MALIKVAAAAVGRAEQPRMDGIRDTAGSLIALSLEFANKTGVAIDEESLLFRSLVLPSTHPPATTSVSVSEEADEKERR